MKRQLRVLWVTPGITARIALLDEDVSRISRVADPDPLSDGLDRATRLQYSPKTAIAVATICPAAGFLFGREPRYRAGPEFGETCASTLIGPANTSKE